MKKTHKWLLAIAGSLILLAGASYAVIYMGTNALLSSLISDEEFAPVPVGGANSAGENDHSNEFTDKEGSENTQDPVNNSDDGDKEASGSSGAQQPERTPEQTNETNESDKQTNVAEPEDPADTPAPDAPPAYNPEISAEKQAEVKENITMSERIKLTTTLVKALDASEISQFMSMAQGGLSLEDKKEAKKIMLEKLSEEEYNELIEIAAKYGLSQGKKYNE